MDSSALGVDDFSACNLTLQGMGGAYRLDCGPRSSFRGSIRTARVGQMLLADVKVSPCVVRRNFANRSIADHYNLVLQVEGSARMRQCGSEAILRPGDLTVIDSRYMSEFEAPQGFQQYAVGIPAGPIYRRFGRGGVPLARTIPGTAGVGRLLADFVASCWHNAAGIHGIDLVEFTLDLVNAATVQALEAQGGTFLRTAGRSDVEQFVDSHIERHDLTPQLLARHFGLSLRQLYRMTIPWGCTPATLIWSRRLARARQLLLESHGRVRVLDVALSCGFKDGAHFSRVYRRTFGHPPRESRERAGSTASAMPARVPAAV